MRCDKCDKPAVVHEMTIKNGVKKEIHLCATHASEAGFIVQQAGAPINQLLKQFVISHGAAKGGPKEARACPQCEMTWAQFRKGGTLGCPKCYETFGDELSPMIQRAHNGATHHVGQTPQQNDAVLERRLEIRRLTQELEKAVASEQYERAAHIRDRLNELDPLPSDAERSDN